MSKHFSKEDFTKLALADSDVHGRLNGSYTARHFDLPPVLHLGTAALYLMFIAVMAAGFRAPGMIIPVAIFAIFIVMAFATPAMWSLMKPDHDDQPLDWASFQRLGIETHTGHSSAGDATIQVLILPVLILCWGITVAVIAALV